MKYTICNCNKLFFIFLLFLLHLSSVELIAATSIVKFLPGFEGSLPFHLETGYIGVGENDEVQLFYYFIKSESDPGHDPVLLWISGGPGCSSFFGIVYDIGPLTIDPVAYNGSLPTLSLTHYSWTKVANIIFLDLPVVTGFSYATTPKANSSDNLQAADHGYQFIQKWFDLHPEFVTNPFYVSGDSYSGITVPMVTQVISNGIEAVITPWINLKGYLLGNPVTSTIIDSKYRVPFAHNMGLIPNELYKSLVKNCKGNYQDSPNDDLQCLKDTATYEQLVSGLYKPHILERSCIDSSASADDLTKSSGFRRSISETKLEKLRNTTPHSGLRCRDDWYHLCEYWANDKSVREALHVREGTVGKWERCVLNLPFTYTVDNSVPYHANISTKSYRSLIFSGDHDMMVPSIGTEAWIKSLNYSVVDEWRPWIFEGQVAGYTRTYSNHMTFATVKGAGHIAPEWKPEECLAMFIRWISHQPL